MPRGTHVPGVLTKGAWRRKTPFTTYFGFFINKYFSTMQEWSFFPYPFEGFPAQEGNPFYGMIAKPRLSDRGIPCRAVHSGDISGGSKTHDVHFTDDDPFVQWLVAILEGRDISPELHEAKPPEDPNKDHDEHNAGGIAWLMGEHFPGPHVYQTTINALQKMTNQ